MASKHEDKPKHESVSRLLAPLLFMPTGRVRPMGLGFILSVCLSAGFLIRSGESFPAIFFGVVGLLAFSMWTFRLRLLAMGEDAEAENFELIHPSEQEMTPKDKATDLLELMTFIYPRPIVRKVGVASGIVCLVIGSFIIVLNLDSMGWMAFGGLVALTGFFLLAASFDFLPTNHRKAN